MSLSSCPFLMCVTGISEDCFILCVLFLYLYERARITNIFQFTVTGGLNENTSKNTCESVQCPMRSKAAPKSTEQYETNSWSNSQCDFLYFIFDMASLLAAFFSSSLPSSWLLAQLKLHSTFNKHRPNSLKRSTTWLFFRPITSNIFDGRVRGGKIEFYYQTFKYLSTSWIYEEAPLSSSMLVWRQSVSQMGQSWVKVQINLPAHDIDIRRATSL